MQAAQRMAQAMVRRDGGPLYVVTGIDRQGRSLSYFNDDQVDYMKYLASLPRERRCECGWSPRGECFGPCYGHADKGGKVITRKVPEPAED